MEGESAVGMPKRSAHVPHWTEGLKRRKIPETLLISPYNISNNNEKEFTRKKKKYTTGWGGQPMSLSASSH